MMRITATWLILLASVLPAAALPAGPPTVAAPSGVYTTAWLTLKGGAFGDKNARLDVPVFLGFRDGKAVVAWFAHAGTSGQKRYWLDDSTLVHRNGKLTGELRGRAVLGADRGGNARGSTPDFVYRFNATVAADGRATGGFDAALTPPANAEMKWAGTIEGTIDDGSSRRDTVAADQSWPSYFGPAGSFAQPAGPSKLVPDLSKARPVWKSEAWILTAYGNATDMRYVDRAGYVAPGGGSGSPVVAGGVVFQYFYRPSPNAPFAAKTHAGKTIDERRAEAERLYARPIERQWFLDLFRETADDVFVAIDAATGRTLWTTVLPQRSPNVQTHKMRWLFPTPRVHDGVVYGAGFGGRLYALDASTGRLIWEFPDANPAASAPTRGAQDSSDCGTPSPVVIGDLIVHATRGAIFGIDRKTGIQRWTTKPLSGVTHAWSKDGKDYLAVSTIERRPRKDDPKRNDEVTVIHLLDRSSGKSLWKRDTEFQHYSYLPLLHGDLLLGYNFGQWKDNAISGGRAIAYRLTPTGIEPAWQTPMPNGTDSYGVAVSGDRVYYSAEKQTLCLDLASGRELARIEGPGGARTQVMFSAADRVFIQPEGRHGTLGFLMIDRTDNKPLPASTADAKSPWPGEWFPPLVHTTAYANQPIMFPIVDGRMFIRGGDAIYCYDLREASVP